MWNHKYGEFTNNQVHLTKESMRKQIYFLLLCVDPNTKSEYSHVNVNDAFDGILTRFGGLNEILLYPKELVKIISLIESALIEYNSENFQFNKYRKLLLDAGNEVLKIKEV